MAYLTQQDNGRWKARVYIPERYDVENHQPSATFDLKREAKAWANEMERKIQRGQYVEPKAIKFREAAEQWMEYARNKPDGNRKHSATTLNRYEGILKNHLNPKFGSRLLSEISVRELEDFYDEKLSSGRLANQGALSAASVKKMHNVLSNVYSYAVKHRLIAKENNPISMNPDVPTESTGANSNGQIEYFSQEEKDRLLKFAREISSYWIVYELGLMGLRKGPVRGLAWDDVSLSDGILRVRRCVYEDREGKLFFDTPKTNNAQRTLHLNEHEVQALKDWREEQQIRAKKTGDTWENEHNLVATATNGQPVSNLTRDFNQLKKSADLPDHRFHSLRHTLATLKFKNAPWGEHLRVAKVVSKRLGHSSVRFTLDRYSGVDEAIEREVMEAGSKATASG